jgi:hypothetical protein
VRNETGADIQAIWQKLFQLEHHRIDRTISRLLSGFAGHVGADALLRTGRSGWLSALALPKILAEIQVVCNDSKLGFGGLFLAGRPEAKRGQSPGQRLRLRFRKNEQNGSGKNSEHHNPHNKRTRSVPSDTKNAQRDLLFQETMIFAQLAVVHTRRARLTTTERDVLFENLAVEAVV